MYDYGARYYDPAIARWTGVDPLADEAPDWTPYRYGFNNPVLYIDPDGMFESRKEARQYRRAQRKEGVDIEGRIRKQSDGTFGIVNKEAGTITQNLEGFGVMTAGIFRATDAMDVSIEFDGEGGYTSTTTRRDGSVDEGSGRLAPKFYGGTAPGPGRFKKILGVLKIFDRISKKYRNRDKKLPTHDSKGNPIDYRKADVDRVPSPSQRRNGARRTKRRVIEGSDGRHYYTNDHYKTFTEIKIPKQ